MHTQRTTNTFELISSGTLGMHEIQSTRVNHPSIVPFINIITRETAGTCHTLSHQEWRYANHIYIENLSLTCNVNCGTFYRKVCSFLNDVQSVELATGGLQSSCRDISRMIKGNWIHLSSIWSVIAKGVEYLLMQNISAFHF